MSSGNNNKIKKLTSEEGKKYIQTYQQNKYMYKVIDLLILYPNFPETTVIVECENKEVIIYCKNNFTEREINIIEKYNIDNIEELVKHKCVSKEDKERCLSFFKFVKAYYDMTEIETYKGFISICLDDFTFLIRVLHNGEIIYIKTIQTKDN